MNRTPWLVVIDPQRIFADPGSEWASPFFSAAMTNITALASLDAFQGRTVVTRWLPTADRTTAWGEYFAAWPFADRPRDDELFSLVDEAAALSSGPTIDLPTFGKWGAELASRVGPHAHLVVTGVSTDCCVISTVLAAVDAGMLISVVTDACAGSTADNHAAALRVMDLFGPQVTLTTTRDYGSS